MITTFIFLAVSLAILWVILTINRHRVGLVVFRYDNSHTKKTVQLQKETLPEVFSSVTPGLHILTSERDPRPKKIIIIAYPRKHLNFARV